MPRAESLSTYQERINRVLDHIAADPSAPHTVASLARAARFSPFHFHRVFRSLVGEPVNAHVRRIRLERAVFRLAHGPKASLTQVALDAGFATSSDFSRAFRQAYGFPPSRYSRTRLLEESKIRQDLLDNRGCGSGTDAGNEDRFRVRVVERAEQPIVYARAIGHDPVRVTAAYDRLMVWGRVRAPGGRLLGRSADDPDITPVDRCRFDWCLTVPASERAGGGLRGGSSPPAISPWCGAAVTCRRSTERGHTCSACGCRRAGSSRPRPPPSSGTTTLRRPSAGPPWTSTVTFRSGPSADPLDEDRHASPVAVARSPGRRRVPDCGRPHNPKKPSTEVVAMDGTWEFVSAELGGQKLPDAALKTMTLVMNGGKYTVKSAGPDDSGTVTTDAAKTPKAMDVSGEEGPNKGKAFPAIYEHDGDTLKICYDLEGKKRPAEFKSALGTKQFLAVYKRKEG